MPGIPDVWLPAKYAGQDEISLAIWGWSGMFKTLSTYPVDIHFSNQAGILLRYLHGTEVHHTPGQPPKRSQWRADGSPSPPYYQIPYRCLVPNGSRNRLVTGRLIDANRGVYGATRVMVACNQTGK